LFPEEVIRAAKYIGIRAFIAPYASDRKPWSPDLIQNKNLILSSNKNEKVQVYCGLMDLELCSDEQIKEAAQISKEHNTGFHIHCSETKPHVQSTVDRVNKRPVEHLRNLGALHENSILAHCVWINEEEQRILSESGVSVVHCPHANLKLGSGFAPVVEMIEEGINVGLGTDGAKANNTLDMFQVMKLTSLLHKGVHQDPSVLSPAQVIQMATGNGAHALNLNGGKILSGSIADLIIIDVDKFHLSPAVPKTALANLVHGAKGSDVDTVIINGEIILESGEFTNIDMNSVLNNANQVAKDLLGQIDY
jgi:5-methylthioadenosine/S-adenosylhomocysteine deaminase